MIKDANPMKQSLKVGGKTLLNKTIDIPISRKPSGGLDVLACCSHMKEKM